ncbi:MAG: flagellar protein FlaG [Lachnospiraceae bacterium]|nr:flagellar protein FlaG [Lachnospiraceae bacterium]
MAISVVNAAASYEAPRHTERQVKAEPVVVESVAPVAAETRPVVAMSGSEMGGSEQEKEQQQANKDKMLRTAVSQANSKLKQTKTKCEFSYHEATKRVSIKVMDEDTGEVIREIPPEETLEMVEKMWELAGILVDERR